ncbi:MAG: glutathione S-transferase family protein [Betaproteobacteria bacterium]|nr:glutathione S-transferase family protein [Betaproteobacteria bacterium]
MAEYTLYCFAESGNSYKAALMLALTGADWTPEWVDYFGGQTRSASFRHDVSEIGEVPVLKHGGELISQSGVILDYLAERTGKFGARNAAHRREIWRWILFDNHKFTSYFATLRFLAGLQKAGDPAVIAFLRQRVEASRAIVENHLAGQPFLAGDEPTIADISAVGYLYYPEHAGVELDATPNIEAWTQRIASLPGWRPPYELMPRGPVAGR